MKSTGESNDYEVTYTCQHCGRRFTRRRQGRGRKPKYCGGKCRNLAYEERHGIGAYAPEL